jgi:hypothetical protein
MRLVHQNQPAAKRLPSPFMKKMPAPFSPFAVILMACLSLGTVNGQPTSASLGASPNPFPQSTQLTISGLSEDTVSLAVFDATGQVVNRFFSNLILSGSLSVHFPANTLSPGVYMALLRVNRDSLLKRLTKTGPALHQKEVQPTAPDHFYPNPARGRLYFSGNPPIQEVHLYDFKGQSLKNWYYPTSPLDVSAFPPGFYFLISCTSAGLQKQKVELR